MSETIRRVASRTKGFTIMVNEALQRHDLSARAKGLYAYMMTLPDDWVVRKPELYSHFTEGREAMETAFKELASAGYIASEEVRTGGRFSGYRHTIHESSTGPQETVNGKPAPGKPLTENQTLLSTNVPSTDVQNTDNIPRPRKSVDLALSDPLFTNLKKSFETRSVITNYPKEMASLKKVCSTIRNVDKDSPISFSERMLNQLEQMIRNGKSDYWKTAPLLPSTMLSRFDQILAAMKQTESLTDVSWVNRVRNAPL